MKKILKLCLCFVFAFGATFGLVACDKDEVKENVEIGTEATIETATSIIPVEYNKDTAEGIMKNSLQNLLSSNKVEISSKESYLEDGIYSEATYEQKTMIKDGKRYTYFNFSGYDKAVLGMYDDKLIALDLQNKTYKDVTPVEPDPNPSGDPESEIAVVTPLVAKLDLITSLVKLSDNVVSGRYFDGTTYINIKVVETDCVTNVEVKIVDGNIIGFETIIVDKEGTGWSDVVVKCGETVDVSVIPTTLDGFTAAA